MADLRPNQQKNIRHKQQRLLLLRHASRCPHDAAGSTTACYPVTPHCATMKRLWEHIAHCTNQNCTVRHCLSSRYVLGHYRRCHDPRCEACEPVRQTMRRSRELRAGRNRSDHEQPPVQQQVNNNNNNQGVPPQDDERRPVMVEEEKEEEVD